MFIKFNSLLAILFLVISCGDSQPSTTSNAQMMINSSEVNTTPTGWWWYHGLTPDQLSQRISRSGGRIVDIKVEKSSPLTLSAALVKNEGAHQQGWYWYYGLTSAQVSEKIKEKSARIISIQSYESGGKKFVVVLAPNTGSSQKAWWWYHGLTSSQVSTKLSENSARLVAINTVGTGSSKRFNVAMIRNTGSDARAWWWYHGLTGPQISEKLSQNRAILADIERDESGMYTVILKRPSTSYKWWWYRGVSETKLKELYNQNGARIEKISTSISGPSKSFDVLMVNNSNALTSRIGEILRRGTVKYGGSTSAYLKRVSGGELAGLNETRSYEPASSLKVLHLLAASKDIDLGKRNAGDLINWSNVSSRTDDPTTNVNEAKDGCLDNFSPNAQISLTAALAQMMQISDNRATEAIRLLFGYTGLNKIASDIGLISTKVSHRIGCGGPVRNDFSTRDAAKIYETASLNSFMGTNGRDAFWAAVSVGRGGLNQIIDSEIARAVDSIPGLTPQQKADKRNELNSSFKANVVRRSKGGSYTLCQAGATNCFPREVIRSRAGRVEIPFKVRGGAATISRMYVYGVFMDSVIAANSSQETEAVNTQATAEAELFRDEIRSALNTFVK